VIFDFYVCLRVYIALTRRYDIKFIFVYNFI